MHAVKLRTLHVFVARKHSMIQACPHAANKCVGASSDTSAAPYVQDYNALSTPSVTPNVTNTLTAVTATSTSGSVSFSDEWERFSYSSLGHLLTCKEIRWQAGHVLLF